MSLVDPPPPDLIVNIGSEYVVVEDADEEVSEAVTY